MKASVALFTADLRVHDNPVLSSALADANGTVVPLFVLDPAVDRAGFLVPNRAAFLADCLADLDAALRKRGGRLIVRHGDVAEQVCRVAHEAGAGTVHVAGGVSGHATRREDRLRRALSASGRELRVHDAVVTVLAPGQVLPSGAKSKGHFAVFTPYFRRWCSETPRGVLRAPRGIRTPEVRSDPPPKAADLAGGWVSPALPPGGEGEGRGRMRRWESAALDEYADRHDDLAGDATSRLSPYLHFGCLSAVELVGRARARGGAGADAFVRQLAWRDFHHQVLAARPDAAHQDYRPRGDRWRHDAEEIAAWRDGRTGYPVVDAGMRQLRHEGWMHNRARLLTASFLTKTLYVDWRVGAAHFLDLLVDGDVANNQLNWQWVAGTGTDTRPNRVLNPLAQAARFDPDGAYVRRWVPELASVGGPAVHRPWRLPATERARLDYPDPIVDLDQALARFRQARRID
ncbi:cryptochrome/photolyase family protein [Kitasatospora sp. NPDC052896]|uniref:cryptochrome/photolyase family protein n=1 Tax=Kitasatospora sp. NPDC052896 TaxID=3364061 RepID=UPI0037CB2986